MSKTLFQKTQVFNTEESVKAVNVAVVESHGEPCDAEKTFCRNKRDRRMVCPNFGRDVQCERLTATYAAEMDDGISSSTKGVCVCVKPVD